MQSGFFGHRFIEGSTVGVTQADKTVTDEFCFQIIYID